MKYKNDGKNFIQVVNKLEKLLYEFKNIAMEKCHHKYYGGTVVFSTWMRTFFGLILITAEYDENENLKFVHLWKNNKTSPPRLKKSIEIIMGIDGPYYMLEKDNTRSKDLDEMCEKFRENPFTWYESTLNPNYLIKMGAPYSVKKNGEDLFT
jgi:hypothetical protein